jgi:hypothetical protein
MAKQPKPEDEERFTLPEDSEDGARALATTPQDEDVARAERLAKADETADDMEIDEPVQLLPEP